MDDKLRILRPGHRVVDLGGAPGGWAQVAAKRVNAKSSKGHVVTVDLQKMDKLPGVLNIQGDFTDSQVPDPFRSAAVSAVAQISVHRPRCLN